MKETDFNILQGLLGKSIGSINIVAETDRGYYVTMPYQTWFKLYGPRPVTIAKDENHDA